MASIFMSAIVDSDLLTLPIKWSMKVMEIMELCYVNKAIDLFRIKVACIG